MRHLSMRNIAFAVSGAIILALVLAGAAKAITEANFRYSTPKTGFLAFPAAAFTPATLNFGYFNTGGQLVPGTTTLTCWFTPVNVPHGANLSALAMWYARVENTDFAFIKLTRNTFATGAEVDLASINGAVTGGAIVRVSSQIPDAQQTVDNARYVYFVRVCLQYNGAGNAPIFNGARLTYTYAHAGD